MITYFQSLIPVKDERKIVTGVTSEPVVLLTGAAGGIGAAIAHRLHADGCRLALHDRDADGLDRLSAALSGDRPSDRAPLLLVDDLVTADPDALVGRAVASYGRLDALVNNAGIIVLAPALEVARHDFEAVVATNLTATFFLSQAAARAMRATGGAIVNIASQLAFVGGAGRAPYAASKAALVQLTRTLAIEWAPLRIRANAVAPGPTDTAMTRARLADPAEAQRLVGRVPLGRAGRPEEVAGAVAYLLGADAAYVTGTTLRVDGGLTAT